MGALSRTPSPWGGDSRSRGDSRLPSVLIRRRLHHPLRREPTLVPTWEELIRVYPEKITNTFSTRRLLCLPRRLYGSSRIVAPPDLVQRGEGRRYPKRSVIHLNSFLPKDRRSRVPTTGFLRDRRSPLPRDPRQSGSDSLSAGVYDLTHGVLKSLRKLVHTRVSLGCKCLCVLLHTKTVRDPVNPLLTSLSIFIPGRPF